MSQGFCYIVGAGSFDGLIRTPGGEDLVIAADGGYTYLNGIGITPQVLLGDFDSLQRIPRLEHLIRHSPIKDDTDMALAVEYGREQGYERFFLYGGLGGRVDHTMANFQLLTGMSKRGMEAYLIGENYIITAITAERLTFAPEARGMVSVFSVSDRAEGVWERGLKYALSDAKMTNDRTLGVSNEFTGVRSTIEVSSGTLLVFWGMQNGLPEKREARINIKPPEGNRQ